MPSGFSLTFLLSRLRLISGLVLMAFVASHLTNLALGLISLAMVESWHPMFIAPWQTQVGETLLLLSVTLHIGLGLWAIARRRTLAIRGHDLVQLLLGMAVPPLLVTHVLAMRIAGEFVQNFQASYGFILSVYWSFSPIIAIQQLLLVVILWIHGAIGLYSWMVLQHWWQRVGGFILPVLFAVPILSLLGFVETGKEVLHLLDNDPAFKASAQQNWTALKTVQPMLTELHHIVLTLYAAAAAAAVIVLVIRLLSARRDRVLIEYDGGTRVIGRRGLSLLEISLANEVPHAHVCGGRGRCGTCRVQVEIGAGHLSPADFAEQKTLASVHAPAGVRLACQARVLGTGLKIRRLLPAYADARAARAPAEWLLDRPQREAAS
jgi:adenylate cyclase